MTTKKSIFRVENIAEIKTANGKETVQKNQNQKTKINKPYQIETIYQLAKSRCSEFIMALSTNTSTYLIVANLNWWRQVMYCSIDLIIRWILLCYI